MSADYGSIARQYPTNTTKSVDSQSILLKSKMKDMAPCVQGGAQALLCATRWVERPPEA